VTSSTSTTTVDPEHSKPFDCDAGFNNWEMGWSLAKMQYCCEHEHRACLPTTSTSTSPAPFDCAAGYDNWEKGWSLGKKAWCCKHQDRGCQTILLPFNCSSGPGDGKENWPWVRRKWCCDNDMGGCPDIVTATSTTSTRTTSTSTTSTSAKYDCNLNLEKWEEFWSSDQQAFCCEHTNKGCSVTTTTTITSTTSVTTTITITITITSTTHLDFDCMSGYVYSNWQERWSDQKKAWCCEHEKRGCNVTVTTPKHHTQSAGPVHYDCAADAAQWRRSWSAGKRVWCCLMERKGCEKVIGDEGSASAPAWVGFDCKSERSNWQMAWSVAKKSCCRDAKGCDPPVVETTRLLQSAFARVGRLRL